MSTKSKKSKPPSTSTWELMSGCDLCTKPAKYSHPLGGQRCPSCPRPEPTDYDLEMARRHKKFVEENLARN